MHGEDWTEKDIEVAARLYRQRDHKLGGQSRIFRKIATELGRTISGVNGRFRDHGPNFTGSEDGWRKKIRYANPYPGQSHITSFRVEIPSRVAAERDRAMELGPQSITAAMMGDPLPGRSALDRRNLRVGTA